MQHDDKLLITRMQQGDRTAMQVVYDRYKDDLLTVARCLLGDHWTAEDCLHDVFVGFVAGLRQLKPNGSLKGYLVACVSNRARDHLRRQVRQVPMADSAEHLPAQAPGPVTQLVAKEQVHAVQTALGRLPYEQREIITLRLHGDLTFREIALSQGVSLNTVQARYRYALERLARLLSGEQP